MAAEPRNPKNAPGPFYVVKGQCISCEVPRSEAPGLIEYDDAEGCYFHKQPETSAEVNDALRAMIFSCVETYRYGGDDPSIRHRLAELGYERLCDRPLEGGRVVVRNHARFSLGDAERATEVASQLLSMFAGTWKSGACSKPVVGDAQRAELEYMHSNNATPLRYVVERLPKPSSVEPSSVYRDPAAGHVWLLSEENGRFPPIWLHEVLIKTGATSIRWFSREELNGDAAGAELPY